MKWANLESFRPFLSFCSQRVSVQLIRRCRSTNPAHRPTFEQVKKFVHRINPIKVSPVDMMMSLVKTSGLNSFFSLTLTAVPLFTQMTRFSQMEKYSKHLEVLVAERTQDLMHEKQRTDRLLYSTAHTH